MTTVIHLEGYELTPIRTVEELRRVLADLPGDLKVFATYEGIFRLLAPEGPQDTQYGRAMVFDAEYHWPADIAHPNSLYAKGQV